MERCLVCNNEYKRVNANHLKTHNLAIEEYKQQYLTKTPENIDWKSIGYGFLKLLLSVLITVVLSVWLIPIFSQFLVTHEWYKIGVSPLETIDPRIETSFPENSSIIDDNMLILRAVISDEGGSGIDWNKSKIELRLRDKTIPIERDYSKTNTLIYKPISLEKGKYVMNIFAYDNSGNDDFKQVSFEVKKKIDLNAIPDNVPIFENGKYYARVVLRNQGTQLLRDLDVSYRFWCDENMKEEQWAKKPNSVLFEDDKMTVLLEADLNFSCSPSAKSNTKTFIDKNTGQCYLVPDDINAPVCVSCYSSIYVWSYREKFVYDYNFLYPYFEGILGLSIEDAGNCIIWEGNEIPESFVEGLYGYTVIDPYSLCLTHQESPRWCREAFTK
jgi:hypothetical protein